MSPLIPLMLAATAALLITFRAKRFAACPPRRHWRDIRHQALAEALVAGLTVLIIGRIADGALTPASYHMRPAFTLLAIGVCLLQYRKTLLLRRA